MGGSQAWCETWGMMIGVWIFVGSAVVSWLCVCGLLPLLRGRVMDVPNERSSHEVATPRGGGIAIVFVVSVVLAGALSAKAVSLETGVLMFGALTMAFLGMADDFSGGLQVGIRFSIQLAVSVVVVFVVGPLDVLPFPHPADLALEPWLAWVVTLIWILGVTNIFNFLDGIDGFAGLQGVVAGLALGWILVPGSVGSALALAAAGGSLGFLFHNWQPARVFMGDVGSLFLGFLFATLPLAVPRDAVAPAVFVTGLALWFFLSDGVMTLFLRLVRGERIWEAHRTHLYQQLTLVGWGHARISLFVMSGGAAVAVAGAWSIRAGGPSIQWIVLANAVAGFLVYWVVVSSLTARASKGKKNIKNG